jgi:hypothetical protein
MEDNNPFYETYYYKLNSSNSWVDYKNVTDYNSEEVGGLATLTVSANKVHVGFNSFGEAKSRDKNLTTNTWENTQSVSNSGSWYERIFAGYNKLFNFFHIPNEGIVITLKVKERSFTDASWSANSVQLNYSVNPYQEGMVSAANTIDQGTHIIYDDEQMVHRKYNASTGLWSEEYIIPNTGLTQSFSLSAVSNDLFLVYKDYPGGSNYLKYTQYDAAPLAPQNLTVSASANNHPLLNWTKNNEADIQHYKIYKYSYAELGWQYYGSSTTNSFEDLNETYVTGGAIANEHWVYYKVTAVDLHPYESPASNQVGARVKGAALEKRGGSTSFTYSLDQNYPNPFNPSTKISYSIKEEGLVTLKVYDILGKEIATLINENKSEGNYEVDFNASALPSGLYIYKIQTGNFTDVKKMILTK